MLTVLSTLQIDWPTPEPGGIAATRSWLDSWPGVGILVTGLNAQGYDIELRQLAGYWRANVGQHAENGGHSGQSGGLEARRGAHDRPVAASAAASEG
jgi:hypothetical protein